MAAVEEDIPAALRGSPHHAIAVRDPAIADRAPVRPAAPPGTCPAAPAVRHSAMRNFRRGIVGGRRVVDDEKDEVLGAGVGDAVLLVCGYPYERAWLDMPGLLADVHTARALQEVERVVVGVAVRWGSAARAELGELGTEDRGVVGADQVVAEPELRSKLGLVPDDVLRREHVAGRGVALTHAD